MKPWTTTKLRASKGAERFACLTAYDALTARLVDQAGIPLILVGDSLATTSLGFETTLEATMEMMLHHTAAVSRATRQAVVVADMPFLSYQISDSEAVRNGGRFLQEAGAQAVKIEGGVTRRATISKLVDNGIPVLGHVGLLPQSVRETGYRPRGMDAIDSQRVIVDAMAVEEAGAFAVVLECVKAELADEITRKISIPTIGIGSGAGCDGQILVLSDLLGMTPEPLPRFVKRYAQLDADIGEAINAYRTEVESGQYPAAEHTY